MAHIEVTGSAGSWSASAAGREIGTLHAIVRPDQRCFVAFCDCREDAYRPLLAAAAAELRRDLYARLDDDDDAGLHRLAALGFAVHRHEHLYRLPTDPAHWGLAGEQPPTGVDLVSAADVDEDRLRELDDALRQDIPGSRGWRWDPAGFADETFGGRDFDPATYLVAVDRSTGNYVGLLRVWMNPDLPRLGCLAVLPAFRRTRVTRALVAAVARVLHDRGHREVVTDVAADNRAVHAMLAGRTAVRAGGVYELIRRR